LVKPSVAVEKVSRVLDVGTWNVYDPRKHSQKKQLDATMRPLGGLYIYPAVDPYRPQQRAMFRAIMTKLSWVLRANVIIQKLVAGQGYTTETYPREDKEIRESELKKWRKQKIYVPYFNAKISPNKLKSWIDRLSDKLDLESIIFNAYLYMREQGRCVIGVFPETRLDGKYQLPLALRIIRPEYTRRPLLNRDTGALEAVEVTGLTTNGGRLDANRAIYLNNAYNLELFADYYGRSVIEPIEDIGKTLLTIYAQDFRQAAEYTWHKPQVFRIAIPARDYKNVDKVLDEFLNKRNNSLGKDIAVTQAVEVLPTTQNSGDIAGVVSIQNECIDAIAGFYNIPPFMLAKGKAGRLGGNANREEIESFLEAEIRPEQLLLENILEKQWYDRILAILFDIEPDEVDDPQKCPIRIAHSFNKPEIGLTIDPQTYRIYLDLAHQGLITKEGLIEKLGLKKFVKEHESTGADIDPAITTWKKINPSWRRTNTDSEWKPKPELNKSNWIVVKDDFNKTTNNF
jgi:hypothetical protein